jgi:hypothetical protein
MEVPDLWKLLQVRDPQGLSRDLREIVAKPGTLHLDPLLTGHYATGACLEVFRNSRQRDGCGDLLQNLSEDMGLLFIER